MPARLRGQAFETRPTKWMWVGGLKLHTRMGHKSGLDPKWRRITHDVIVFVSVTHPRTLLLQLCLTI